MKKPHGNGSGEFEIGHHDMDGWVRIVAGHQNLPDDLPAYLSQALSDWFRQRPQFRMQCVVPIQSDGNTVELHAWYEVHVLPTIKGSQPEGKSDQE